MKISPLQLVYYRVMELSMAYRMEFDRNQSASEAICSDIKASLEIYRDEEDDSTEATAWTIILQLEFAPPEGDNSPYDFKVELLSVFRCAKNLPLGLDAETMVGINGTSVLYGIARELIQSLTEKAFWGGLTLPTMSFTDFRDMLKGAGSTDPTKDIGLGIQ
jgi:preprotein translocase subunit SecB